MKWQMALLHVPQQINVIYCDIYSKQGSYGLLRQIKVLYQRFIHYDTKNAFFCIWDAFDMFDVLCDNQ